MRGSFLRSRGNDERADQPSCPGMRRVYAPLCSPGLLCHFPAGVALVSVPVLFLFQTSFSRGFTKNMKLEAVNPRNPGELCVASVVNVKGRLMWLHLEGTHSGCAFRRAGACLEMAGCRDWLSGGPAWLLLYLKRS